MKRAFFKLQAAKTGHVCIERWTKVQSSLRDGDNTVNAFGRRGASTHSHPLTDRANTHTHTRTFCLSRVTPLFLSTVHTCTVEALTFDDRESSPRSSLPSTPPHTPWCLPHGIPPSWHLVSVTWNPSVTLPPFSRLLCLDLPCMHLDISASGCIGERK